MDYLQLARAIVLLYAAVIPLYIAIRIFRFDKRFFTVSATLGFGLFIHGLSYCSALLGNEMLRVGFDFTSALLIFFLTVYYTYVRWGVKRGG